MPRSVPTSPYELAKTYIGEVEEFPGPKDNHPLIQWGHKLCGLGRDVPDEVAWCSSVLQVPCYQLRLPRSKSAAARSWLEVGLPIRLEEAEPGFDVVVIKRGPEPQPGPEVTKGAPGHVGLFAGYDSVRKLVTLLGGNQSDAFCLADFPAYQVLGVRRLLV